MLRICLFFINKFRGKELCLIPNSEFRIPNCFGQQCTAGAIDVTFSDALAQCYTYTTEERSFSLQVSKGAGDVSQCDVIDCLYNEGQRCRAETIAVTFMKGTAQYATYTLAKGATG
jgi:hypothetical protein